MHFENSAILFLLLLLVPYIVWYVMSRGKGEPTMSVPDTSVYRSLRPSRKVWLVHVPFLLRLVTFAMLIVALARPQVTNRWTDREVNGIDIMMALDISTSMLSEDLKPNRIQAAKTVGAKFISNSPNDNIGLTVFAAEAFTQCPLTTDHASLLNLFQNVDCGLAARGVIEDGTAIGMGLANAISRLTESKAKSKIIILLTDGSNNRGDISPNTAAKIAKVHGIRVYTIGVGTNGTAPYPYPLPGGGVQYIQTPVEIDTQSLTEIANLTGGKYYRATSNKELNSIYDDIGELEKTKYSVKQYSKRNDAYQQFAIIALFSLLLELLLRTTLLRRIP